MPFPVKENLRHLKLKKVFTTHSFTLLVQLGGHVTNCSRLGSARGIF